jgi:ribosomal protein S18 acetylase RimI-like enzyme
MDHGAKPPPEFLIVENSLPEDRESIGEVARDAGAFTSEEVATVWELFDASMQSQESGYAFFSARTEGRLAGFACWGATPLTEGTYDLYWICADRDSRKRGIGRALFGAVESAVASLGGRMIVIETSSAEAYLPAIRFYERMGCRLAARIADYYRPGEDLLMYIKNISQSSDQP